MGKRMQYSIRNAKLRRSKYEEVLLRNIIHIKIIYPEYELYKLLHALHFDYIANDILQLRCGWKAA